MNKQLLNWINKHNISLCEKGIITQNVKIVDNVLIPACRIDQINDKYISSICAWENNLVDFEVLDIATGNQINFSHFEDVKSIDYIIDNYLNIMLS